MFALQTIDTHPVPEERKEKSGLSFKKRRLLNRQSREMRRRTSEI